MELDSEESRGNIQTWNFRFFGFYPGYLTLHNKKLTDKSGKSAVVVGTNFKTKKLPNIYAIKGKKNSKKIQKKKLENLKTNGKRDTPFPKIFK